MDFPAKPPGCQRSGDNYCTLIEAVATVPDYAQEYFPFEFLVNVCEREREERWQGESSGEMPKEVPALPPLVLAQPEKVSRTSRHKNTRTFLAFARKSSLPLGRTGIFAERDTKKLVKLEFGLGLVRT